MATAECAEDAEENLLRAQRTPRLLFMRSKNREPERLRFETTDVPYVGSRNSEAAS
jgi:hypothetical protein